LVERDEFIYVGRHLRLRLLVVGIHAYLSGHLTN
jgi:hypothetical protein